MNKKYSKVIFVTDTLSSGGSERVISILSDKFLKYFDEVEIICYRDMPIFYKINKKIQITIIDNKLSGCNNLLKKACWFRKYIADTKPDIVIPFMGNVCVFTIISLLFLGIPVLATERIDPTAINIKLRMLRNIAFLFATHIVVQTDKIKESYVSIIKKKISVIYNPYIYKVNDNRKSLVAKGILSIGRLAEQKNHSMLINAFSTIHKNFPDQKLTILGEGPLRKLLSEQITKLDLNSNVDLPGRVDNVEDYILESEIFVLSSNYEGMSNALIEAMSLGKPVISTKVSGSVEIVEHGVNGLLIEIGDESGLVDSIKHLLDDKELAMKIGGNAIKVRELFEPGNIAKQWLSVIMKTIGAKNG